jgi:hypothetical protein
MTYSAPSPGKTREKRRLGFRRLKLRGSKGTYMNRWGLALDQIGGVYLHRMDAPDPGGYSLHDHEWAFFTVVLWGGYEEARADIIEGPNQFGRGKHGEKRTETRRLFRPRFLGRGECHAIMRLRRKVCWTLLFRGPRRGTWSLYSPRYVPPTTKAIVPYTRADLWDDMGYPFGGMYYL